MAMVTLIGVNLAETGVQFRYIGPNTECRNCRLKTVCFNLKPGRLYEITAVRDKEHTCGVHEDHVVVVEVTELPLVLLLEKSATVGSSVKINRARCRQLDCEHYSECMNPGVKPEKTYTVQKLLGEVSCPKGKTLYKVELSE